MTEKGSFFRESRDAGKSCNILAHTDTTSSFNFARLLKKPNVMKPFDNAGSGATFRFLFGREKQIDVSSNRQTVSVK